MAVNADEWNQVSARRARQIVGVGIRFICFKPINLQWVF